jgi:hypothetical protein
MGCKAASRIAAAVGRSLGIPWQDLAFVLLVLVVAGMRDMNTAYYPLVEEDKVRRKQAGRIAEVQHIPVERKVVGVEIGIVIVGIDSLGLKMCSLVEAQ